MGLDMYLKAELYVSGWDHAPAEERNKYDTLLEVSGLHHRPSACQPARRGQPLLSL